MKTAKSEVITDEVLSVEKPKAELIKVAIKPVEKEPEVAQKPIAPAVAKEKTSKAEVKASAPKEVSSVDAIIAAMQEVKSDVSEKAQPQSVE